MKCPAKLSVLAKLVLVALLLGGCGTSVPLNAKVTISEIVGTYLPGAQGNTSEDQDKIDSAMAGLCASGAYEEVQGEDLCELHTKASADRRRSLGRSDAEPLTN